MATVGSLSYGILANMTDFKAGITASRGELKSLRTAFLDTQKPVERFSGAMQHLQTLMDKFPSRANEVRRSMHALKREMDSARFAQGARIEAGFMADLDAGLARNARAGTGGPMAAAAGERMLTLQQGAATAGQAITALRTGSILPLIGSLGTAGLAGAAIAAGAAMPILATRLAMIADASKQAREEFFKNVDALNRMGENTSFANHVERVKSLKTAWGEVTSASQRYLTTTVDRLDSGGNGSFLSGASKVPLAMIGMGSLPAENLSSIAGGLNAATNNAETQQQKMARVAEAMATDDRVKRARERVERVNALEEKARQDQLKAEQQFNERMSKAREAADLRAYEHRRSRFDTELKERLSKLNAQLEAAADMRERLRTPAERMRGELDDIMGNPHIDRATRLRALEELKSRAEGMLPKGGGDPVARSVQGIRAGSVEALRAQFSGGDKRAKADEAAVKTAKHTADTVAALGKIEAALKGIAIGEAP